MDNTTAYLAVLARIMQEERAETTTKSCTLWSIPT